MKSSLILISLFSFCDAAYKEVTVKGHLTCIHREYDMVGAFNETSVSVDGAYVILRERNMIFRDDRLNESITNETGMYDVSGGKSELWGHEYYLEISLSCDKDNQLSYCASEDFKKKCEETKPECYYVISLNNIPEMYYNGDIYYYPFVIGDKYYENASHGVKSTYTRCSCP